MNNAALFTFDACEIFAGPHAAKRMAREIGNSPSACEAYLAQRRRLSLDAAIELAANNDKVRAALLLRIEQARERNAGDRRTLAFGRGGMAATAGRTQDGTRVADRKPGQAIAGHTARVSAWGDPLTGPTRGRP